MPLKSAGIRVIMAVLLTLCVSTVLATPETPARPYQAFFPLGRMTLLSAPNMRTIISVEMATTAESRSIGLMGRPSLAENTGMLFVFDHDEAWSFWMRGTLIPLSIAFITADGRIVEIQDMRALDETLHTAARPVRMALEMRQGYFAEKGISVGDQALLWRGQIHLPVVMR